MPLDISVGIKKKKKKVPVLAVNENKIGIWKLPPHCQIGEARLNVMHKVKQCAIMCRMK